MSERSAIKRSCFSPTHCEEIKRNRVMKERCVKNPLVLLLREGVMKARREDLINSSRDLEGEFTEDLIGSFGQSSDHSSWSLGEETRVQGVLPDRVPTPTCCQISTDILGSPDSLSAKLEWPMSASPSNISSFSNKKSLTSCQSFALMSRLSSRSSSFSSSYTSWTKPCMGNKLTDSFIPPSSILDQEVEVRGEEKEGEEGEEMRSYMRVFRDKRDSSGDTSKDIDEIDDLELDMELPEDDFILITEEEEGEEMLKMDKRLSGIMSSPDLAYGSMQE